MKKIIPIAMLAAFLTGGCTTSSRFIPISACQKDQNEPSGSSLEERSSFFVVEHPGRQNLADYLKFEFNISDMSRDVIKLGGYYVDINEFRQKESNKEKICPYSMHPEVETFIKAGFIAYEAEYPGITKRKEFKELMRYITAQAILETGNFTSQLSENYNFFGVKDRPEVLNYNIEGIMPFREGKDVVAVSDGHKGNTKTDNMIYSQLMQIAFTKHRPQFYGGVEEVIMNNKHPAYSRKEAKERYGRIVERLKSKGLYDKDSLGQKYIIFINACGYNPNVNYSEKISGLAEKIEWFEPAYKKAKRRVEEIKIESEMEMIECKNPKKEIFSIFTFRS